MENSHEIPRKLLFLNGTIAVLIVLVSFAIYWSAQNDNKKSIAESKKETFTNTFFKNIPLLAESVYVYDVKNEEALFEKNPEVQYPLASVTKLMMALTASELVSNDSRIIIKREFLNEEGDSGLLADETWRLKDLLDLSLVVSSNDGARSIASVIGATILNTDDYNLGRKEFVSLMNQKAIDLGLSQTYFINENGLDIDNFSGGYGTAKDISKLMQYIIRERPEVLEATKYKTITVDSFSKSHTVNNTNKGIDNILGLIGSKTGYTSQAGGNLVVAFDASIGRPIIVVVMGSTLEGRFSDVKSLVYASLNFLRKGE